MVMSFFIPPEETKLTEIIKKQGLTFRINGDMMNLAPGKSEGVSIKITKKSLMLVMRELKNFDLSEPSY